MEEKIEGVLDLCDVDEFGTAGVSEPAQGPHGEPDEIETITLWKNGEQVKVPYDEWCEEQKIRRRNDRIGWIVQNCLKRGEPISKEEATELYDGFVEGEMLDHYPEDSDTLWTIIQTYNYLNR